MRLCVPWSVDALGAGIVVTFFVVGLGGCPVFLFSTVLWLATLAAPTVVMGGSLLLGEMAQPAAATVLHLCPPSLRRYSACSGS